MTKLFNHQKEALKALKKEEAFALFMEQGTGKTLTIIKHMERLIKKDKVRRVLVFAPSAVVPNWLEELSKFLDVEYIAPEYEGKKRASVIPDKKDERVFILVVNYEKAHLDKKHLAKFKADMLICDESQKVKSHKTKVNKTLYFLSKSIPYRYLLTGTPISTGYEDIYGQFLIMNSRILGTRWADFEGKYLKKGGYLGKQIVGYRNIKKLKKLIDRHSYIVHKKDCLDLPPVTEQTLYCELGAAARRAYADLDKELIADMSIIMGEDTKALRKSLAAKKIPYNKADDYLTLLSKAQALGDKYTMALDSALVKTQKLQQITGGFLKTEEGTIALDTAKLKLLDEVIEQSSKPVVVFCKYRAEINAILEQYKNKYKIEQLSGKTKDKGKVNKDFQAGKYDILVVQIRTGSTGINLTRSSTAIFYSWSHSYIDFAQAKARIDRIGQGNNVSIYYLVARKTIDETILTLVKERDRMSKELLKKKK